MTWLRFQDGRDVETAQPAAGSHFVYVDKLGREYILQRVGRDTYEEAKVRQLTRWECDRGHTWWGEDAKPGHEPECGRCRNLGALLSGRVPGL
jgi:hypothetical protein